MSNKESSQTRSEILQPSCKKKKNDGLQYSAVVRNRELTRLTQTSTGLTFRETVKLIGLNPHPIPYSTQTKHRTFPSPSVLTCLQITSIDEFDIQWGSITFHNPISGLK